MTTIKGLRLRQALSAALVVAVIGGTACDDDSGEQPREPSPGTTAPFVEPNTEPLDSTGGPGGTVLNNQPTSPAANNAPPGQDGTG